VLAVLVLYFVLSSFVLNFNFWVTITLVLMIVEGFVIYKLFYKEERDISTPHQLLDYINERFDKLYQIDECIVDDIRTGRFAIETFDKSLGLEGGYITYIAEKDAFGNFSEIVGRYPIRLSKIKEKFDESKSEYKKFQSGLKEGQKVKTKENIFKKTLHKKEGEDDNENE